MRNDRERQSSHCLQKFGDSDAGACLLPWLSGCNFWTKVMISFSVWAFLPVFGSESGCKPDAFCKYLRKHRSGKRQTHEFLGKAQKDPRSHWRNKSAAFGSEIQKRNSGMNVYHLFVSETVQNVLNRIRWLADIFLSGHKNLNLRKINQYKVKTAGLEWVTARVLSEVPEHFCPNLGHSFFQRLQFLRLAELDQLWKSKAFASSNKCDWLLHKIKGAADARKRYALFHSQVDLQTDVPPMTKTNAW